MKAIIVLNLTCFIWLGVCFYLNLDPWVQVAILVPNMIGWTLLPLIV